MINYPAAVISLESNCKFFKKKKFRVGGSFFEPFYSLSPYGLRPMAMLPKG